MSSMLLYRIGKTKYAKDREGAGAKLNGGRWNHEGIPCIYTAESRALSLLEYSVHVSIDMIPKALSFTTFQAADDSVFETKITTLPHNWNQWPHSKESRDFGTGLIKENKFLILKFPSAIIPDEFIYVINTLHARIKEVKIIEVQNYLYDPRLKS
jgi:RES domain-containing protein